MNFHGIKLKIASPDEIVKWSNGEVIKPETINYRTQRPEKDGLFSERIFGPTKDWECYCGKYRRIRYKGVVCDKCGVEVTRAIVRRERMGHITLAIPVAHIWFLRSIPSKISLLLDVPLPKVEKVIYYISYIVTAMNDENHKRALDDIKKEYKSRKKTAVQEGVEADTLKEAMEETIALLEHIHVGQVLTETEFHSLARRFGDVFEAGTGAEAIRKILEHIDFKEIIKQVKKELEDVKDVTKEMRLLRRLKLATAMSRNNLRAEWMILTVLPVLPPDLRPMVALDGGRFATSDLNDLYRRVINRNNRLKKLIELNAPEIITINEKRMLQESVDALFDNSARFGSQQLSAQRRPLRSLADYLKGKQGRFRQNLLGKRVDYSARSVIVVGPELKLDQCGLPKKMALEIFKPFVINKIIERDLAHNIRNANRLIDQAPPEIWAILEEVIAGRKVLLNRAPTLHRLGIQAFQPLLIEDFAIRIPPLVCTAFNADFDGDQMAVHLPLTDEAQKEASELMLASHNILKPATGEPIVYPTQDVVLGCYFLTKETPGALGAGKLFATPEEASLAHDLGYLAIGATIRVGKLETTLGRLIFNRALPEGTPYVNANLNKSGLMKLISSVINRVGLDQAASIMDKVKVIGFKYATRSGISWGMGDLVTPVEKQEIISKANTEEGMIREQYDEGLLTAEERRSRVIEIWMRAKLAIEKVVRSGTLDPQSSVYYIIDSGARGSWSQPVQMMGMKGLVVNPQNQIIELPIKTSLKEGHTVLEYFISTHGARKGTTDTALKTASAGYLSRRLVDACQDLVIQESDCRTKEGVEIVRSDGQALGQSYASRVFSRSALEDVMVDGVPVVEAGGYIDKLAAEKIEASKLISVKVRSPITCKTLYGICSKCYGYDLGKNEPIFHGEAVGILAAQSIGEPGTQLTMRTFHTGGVAGADITHGLPRVEELFEARVPKGKAFLSEDDGVVSAIEERGLLKLLKITASVRGKAKALEYAVPRSAEIYFKIGDEVKKGDQLCEGSADIKELFKLKGAREAERYVVNEVQKIYVSEGASINNKHLEIIVRQMFSRVRIKEPGGTEFIPGEVIEKSRFLEVNRAAKKADKQPAKAIQLFMGITKVALSSESFLSAASFMETAKVLINAASEGKVDILRGLKENVIIGRLIPVGTGFRKSGQPTATEEAHAAERAGTE